MIGILHIGRNINLAQEILDLNEQATLRVKHVDSLEQAEEWLRMQSFQIISFDETVAVPDLVSFLIDAWSTQQSIIGAYVSTAVTPKELSSVLILGLEECTGPDCIAQLKKITKKVPITTNVLSTRHSTVLLVEDLDSPRDIICALIQSLGYEQVIGVGSVEEAFEVLQEDPFKFFCVITDINMPERSGLSFIEELREDMALAYLPVVILTSDPSEENLLEALKFGITGFLAKPPKRTLLKAELEKAKRLVLLGKSPEIGTTQELKLLENAIRNKRSD